jgi:hypothetical protein
MPPRKPAARKRKAPEYEHYVFQIASPRRSYSFSVNKTQIFKGLYWEHPAIRFTGQCIPPARFEGRSIKADIVGGEVENEAPKHDPNWKPLAIGSLELSKREASFYAKIPLHSFWGLSAAIQSGELPVMYLYGPALYRGKSLITNLDFETEFNPDDVS